MTNVVKVSFRWTLEQWDPGTGLPDEFPITDVVTTFHVHAVDSHAAPDADDRAAIAAAALSWWQEEDDDGITGSDHFATSMLLTHVEAQTIKPALSDKDVFDNLFPRATGSSLNHLPPQCAYVVGLNTSVNTRRGRGRIYWPPTNAAVMLPEWQTGRVHEDAQHALGKMTAELARRISLLEGGPGVWALAVYSRVDGDARAVVSFDIPDVIGTQRRRAFTPAGKLQVGLSGEP